MCNTTDTAYLPTNSPWASRLATLLLGFALITPALPAAAAQKLALVVGNNNYTPAPDKVLVRPKADAIAMEATLSKLGFTVRHIQDVDKKTFENEFRAFRSRVKEGDEVVFYFAGHGTDIPGRGNVLLALHHMRHDYPPDDLIEDAGMELRRMLNDLARIKPRMVLALIDACRTYPLNLGKRSNDGALQTLNTSIKPPKGQMVLYASTESQPSWEGTHRGDQHANSPFTRVLAEQLLLPGLPLVALEQAVRTRVEALFDAAPDVRGEQRRYQLPTAASSLTGDYNYSLNPAPRQPNPIVVKAPVAAQAAPATPETPNGLSVRELFECELCPSMGTVPAQTFLLDDKHRVTVPKAFEMMTTEVTVAQYLRCVQDGGCKEPEWRERGNNYHYLTGSEDHYKRHGAALTAVSSPIVGVSWVDAKAYAAWLSQKTQRNYQLPTEAQWEAAARGGKTGDFGFDGGEAALGQYAWFAGNANNTLHAVGGKSPNAYGLYDMHGNVWEWVKDCHAYAYAPALTGGAANAYYAHREDDASCQARVLRGGSWYVSAQSLRVADRGGGAPDDRSSFIGFRLTRMLP